MDSKEALEEIVWRVDSKIAEVRRTSGSTKKNLRFDYDAMGNRIAKHIYADNAFTQWENSTYYVRDASGNVMATYEREATGQTPPSSFRVAERHLYGSSRLGIDATPHEFIATNYISSPEAERSLGQKHYEISNHLGNVLSVITDQKLPVVDAGAVVSYAAVVMSATDYSPFGVGLYGRSWSEGYRYGFNGKEKLFNYESSKDSYLDLGERLMSTKLGRIVTTDPRETNYPWQSPYAYYSNSPVAVVDFMGLGDYYTKDGKKLGSDGKTKTVGKGKDAKKVSDDKAYITTEEAWNEQTKDGNTNFDAVIADSRTEELTISNSTLGKFANTVANESSGNKNESFALASAIVNLSEYRNKDILKTLKTEGIYGYNGKTDYTNRRHGLEAVFNALTGGEDLSNGAIRWDGFDLAAKGFDHVKPKDAGVSISKNHFDAFKSAWPNGKVKSYSGGSYDKFSDDFSAGIHLATSGNNKGMCLYSSSAVHGGTIFWKGNGKDFVSEFKLLPPAPGVPCGSFIKTQPNSNFTGHH